MSSRAGCRCRERLTKQIADTIRDKIAPLGVAVVMEATHLCMSMRGVEKQNSFAVTSAMQGAFRDNSRTRMEFLELIKLRSAVSDAARSGRRLRLRRGRVRTGRRARILTAPPAHPAPPARPAYPRPS